MKIKKMINVLHLNLNVKANALPLYMIIRKENIYTLQMRIQNVKMLVAAEKAHAVKLFMSQPY